MWDTLQLTHEGSIDVKRSRINTLTNEYELFRMNTNENIQNQQSSTTQKQIRNTTQGSKPYCSSMKNDERYCTQNETHERA